MTDTSCRRSLNALLLACGTAANLKQMSCKGYNCVISGLKSMKHIYKLNKVRPRYESGNYPIISYLGHCCVCFWRKRNVFPLVWTLLTRRLFRLWMRLHTYWGGFSKHGNHHLQKAHEVTLTLKRGLWDLFSINFCEFYISSVITSRLFTLCYPFILYYNQTYVAETGQWAQNYS